MVCIRKAEFIPPSSPGRRAALPHTHTASTPTPYTYTTGRNGCQAKEIWDVCEVEHDAGLKAFLWRSLRRQPGYLFCRQEEEASSAAVTVSSERGKKGKGKIETEEKQVRVFLEARGRIRHVLL